MIEDLQHALHTFEESLRKVNPKLADLWRPGLLEAAICQQLQRAGVPCDPRLITLFQWHDGLDFGHLPSDQLIFGPFAHFSNLEGCLVGLQIFKEVNRKDPGYAPESHFFSLSHEDNILLNLHPEDTKIYLYAPKLMVVEPEVIYDSLSSMFLTFAKSFEEKVVTYDKNGEIRFDYKELAEFNFLNNPDSTHWLNYI